MDQINKGIIHASATAPQYDIGVEDIKVLHTLTKGTPITWCGKDLEGNGWSDIGYHYVIRRDGSVEKGRPDDVQGAHVLGHNHGSLGICMVGGEDSAGRPDCNFTWRQWRTLDELCDTLNGMYGHIPWFGHRDFTDEKACPCFDVAAWRNGGKNK